MKANRIHFVSRRSGSRIAILLAVTVGMLGIVTQGQAVTRALTINEHGQGSYMEADGSTGTLSTETIQYDMGSAGSPHVVSATLFISPWSITAGDVILHEDSTDGPVSDVIRFLQANMFTHPVGTNPNDHGIIFFSDTDTSDENPADSAPADVGIPTGHVDPSGFTIPNWHFVDVIEAHLSLGRGNGADYTATGTVPNIPGTDDIPNQVVNYTFVSDAVPEPTTGIMVGLGLVGMLSFLRRCR